MKKLLSSQTNYEKYLINLFSKPLDIMRKLHLTEDELLKLEYAGITPEGFDLKVLTEIIIDRYRKDDNTTFKYDNNNLIIDCPFENNEFKTEIIRFLSNFPTYEIKFINNGY